MAQRVSRPDLWLSLADLAAVTGQREEACLRELQRLTGDGASKTYVEPERVRRFLEAKGHRFERRVFSFQMLKGGVAKTTSALNFGWRAAMYGARVLLLDLDQQANLTFALGEDAEDRPVWIDVLEKKAKIQDVVLKLEPGLDLIPSSLNNSILDRYLISSHRNWATAVKAPLKEISAAYDVVIIDTAPSLSAINTAVTCASDVIVLPINPDRFSLIGVKKHLEDLEELKEEFDLRFDARVLFTRYDGRETASREILGQCIESFDRLLIKNYIRTSSELKNSVLSGKTVFSTKNAAHEDYDLVTRELLGMSS